MFSLLFNLRSTSEAGDPSVEQPGLCVWCYLFSVYLNLVPMTLPSFKLPLILQPVSGRNYILQIIGFGFGYNISGVRMLGFPSQ